MFDTAKTQVPCPNPIRPEVPDPGINQGGGAGFNLRALDCCLTLKLCVCFQNYKLTSHEK